MTRTRSNEPVWLKEALACPTRHELRHEPVFTVDPPNSKVLILSSVVLTLLYQDLDDAIHVTELSSGKYVLGVHIADVSYFVKRGDDVDKGARKKICTAYHGARCVSNIDQSIIDKL